MPEGLLNETAQAEGAVAVLALLILWAFIKEILPLLLAKKNPKPPPPRCAVDTQLKRAVFDAERSVLSLRGDVDDMKKQVGALGSQMSVLLDRSRRDDG